MATHEMLQRNFRLQQSRFMILSSMEFTDANFNTEVIAADIPVLVDFWAPWCGPCRIQGPIIEELAQGVEGKFKVGKLNVDDNPETAQKFNVMSIPTIFVFKKGQIVQQFVGVQSKEKLMAALEAAA